MFDIIDFYSPISEDLLLKSLAWVKNFTKISELEQKQSCMPEKQFCVMTKETRGSKKTVVEHSM